MSKVTVTSCRFYIVNVQCVLLVAARRTRDVHGLDSSMDWIGLDRI